MFKGIEILLFRSNGENRFQILKPYAGNQSVQLHLDHALTLRGTYRSISIMRLTLPFGENFDEVSVLGY